MPRLKATIEKMKREAKKKAREEWRHRQACEVLGIDPDDPDPAGTLAKREAKQNKRAAKTLEPPVPPEQLLQSPHIVFKLTPRQDQAMDLLIGDQRHTMLVGGSRSGKTFLLVRAIIMRALRGAGSRHVIFRLRGNACRQAVWMDTFAKVMRLCFPQTKVTPHLMDGYVVFDNGSEIWFAGLDDKERVEKILGMEFITIYFCECSQIPYASVEVALTRLAQKIDGLKARAYYDLNPTTHKHWTALLFLKGINPTTRRPVVDPHNYKWMKINPVDNTENIDQDYIASLEAMSARARKRFYDGEYLEEVDGALWTPEIIERSRVDTLAGTPNRLVIAVDPSGAKGEEDKRSDEIGISVVAKYEGHAFVLKDATMKGRPEEWGKRVVELFFIWKADCIVAEKNFGGDMVRSTIHAVNENVKVKLVTAARGKVVRAEPVSALFEKGTAHLVGNFTEMEEEMACFTADKYMGDRSPNRTDAMVWGITELMLEGNTAALLGFYTAWGQAQEGGEDANAVKTPAGVIMPAQMFDPIEFMRQLEALRPKPPERDKSRAW